MVCHYGVVAQLGECLPCKQEVEGSIPFGSMLGGDYENTGYRGSDILRVKIPDRPPFATVAQLVAQPPCKRYVAGSSPVSGLMN